MSVLTVQAWHCDLCGQTWLSEAKPKRCSKCKSSKWDLIVIPSDAVTKKTLIEQPTPTYYPATDLRSTDWNAVYAKMKATKVKPEMDSELDENDAK